MYPYLGAVFREMGSPTLAGNGTADHVHVLFRLARTVTIADVVEEVKKRSSKWIKTKGPSFEHFQWQTGYGAFSIGQSGVEALQRYIANQKEHHRTVSFQDEYLRLLKKYNIPYEVRYVWD